MNNKGLLLIVQHRMQAGNLSEIMFFKTHCLVPKKGQTVQHLCWGDTELVNHCHFYYAQAEYHRTSKAKHLLSEKNDLRSRAFFFFPTQFEILCI